MFAIQMAYRKSIHLLSNYRNIVEQAAFVCLLKR
jgi:hypothetical protein